MNYTKQPLLSDFEVLPFGELLDDFADHASQHSLTTVWWSARAEALATARESLRQSLEIGGVNLGEIGPLRFPFVEMGSINSCDLFGLDELIIFSFYWRNRDKYKTVVDLGANIGLHTLVLSKIGFETNAYEPDPIHAGQLSEILKANQLENFSLRTVAVAEVSGVASFTRVLGNTTGSHLSGAKDNPYGDLEIFEVETVAISDAIIGADLVKMDVEGMEKVLLPAISMDSFAHTDFLVEIGSPESAARVFDHVFGLPGVNVFSQKSGWTIATALKDMPVSHREGSVFISSKSDMPW